MPEALRPDAIERPHPSRFAADRFGYHAALRAHAAAVEAGQAGYLDPTTGLFVMTAAYHVARGRCCANDCRHCPYVGAPAAPSSVEPTGSSGPRPS